MGYKLEGSILEVCTCNILCPCWVGEDPDGDGTCDAIVAYHFDKGAVNGTDVSGRTLALLAHVPGNILKGNWRVVLCVDDGASQQQQDALVNVWSGKEGGPVADLAGLVGEVIGVEKLPITFQVAEGRGTLKIGSVAEAVMAPYQGAMGGVTTLTETAFTTIPGSPAWVGKASKYTRQTSKWGLKDINLQDHNAIQGTFRFEC